MDADELARGARDLIVDDAIAQRARRTSRRAVADELTTLSGLLVDAARRRVEVAMTLLADHHVRMVPTLVGPDVVAGARVGAPTEIVAMRAIAAVELATPTGADPDGEPDGPPLHDVLTAIVDERPPVAVWTVDGQGPHAGDLLACGLDVILLGTGAGGRRAIPLTSIGRIRIAP